MKLKIKGEEDKEEEKEMRNKTKMVICIIGLVLSTQIQWIIGNAEIFNGIGLVFGIGFGWYACKSEPKGL